MESMFPFFIMSITDVSKFAPKHHVIMSVESLCTEFSFMWTTLSFLPCPVRFWKLFSISKSDALPFYLFLVCMVALSSCCRSWIYFGVCFIKTTDFPDWRNPHLNKMCHQILKTIFKVSMSTVGFNQRILSLQWTAVNGRTRYWG